MHFEISRDPETHSLRFSGELDALDMAEMRLTRFDTALLRDVESDQNATSADYLLALEMLFRRATEARATTHHQEPNDDDDA